MALETRRLAQHFIAALAALEERGEEALDGMVELFSPMSRLTNTMLTRRHTELTGELGAREFWTEYRRSFREVRTAFYEVTWGDRSAGLFWTTHGTTAQGLPIEYDGATLLVYEDDGQIILLRGYYDSRDLALHLSPSPARAAADTSSAR